ncbi:unnamed protein product [Ceratitis capitata]|uniref:(Mediterranean fruit fly) hypothetical protein n=1 Tax=Ceratitis capitata TaxID=7213 RepID=A0A811UAP9_CERCA|nr:unnamed protein product [Ceratitis capitata]
MTKEELPTKHDTNLHVHIHTIFRFCTQKFGKFTTIAAGQSYINAATLVRVWMCVGVFKKIQTNPQKSFRMTRAEHMCIHMHTVCVCTIYGHKYYKVPFQ